MAEPVQGPPQGAGGGMRRVTAATAGALAVLYLAFRRARSRARREDAERSARIDGLRRRLEALERPR